MDKLPAHPVRKTTMNRKKAKRMFKAARKVIVEPSYTPCDFNSLKSSDFLTQYCHVVFTSGFSATVVQDHAEALAKSFKGFKLADLAKMEFVNASGLKRFPIKNLRKINCFLGGARAIAKEGYKHFKARVREGGKDTLMELPNIGKVTVKHLAMITGVEDVAKDDRWLVRCANECSTNVDNLVEFLATEFGLERWEVDCTLWEYCRQSQHTPPTD